MSGRERWRTATRSITSKFLRQDHTPNRFLAAARNPQKCQAALASDPAQEIVRAFASELTRVHCLSCLSSRQSIPSRVQSGRLEKVRSKQIQSLQRVSTHLDLDAESCSTCGVIEIQRGKLWSLESGEQVMCQFCPAPTAILAEPALGATEGSALVGDSERRLQ